MSDEQKELLEASKAVLKDLRGWLSVIRRSYGHHSQESAYADNRYSRLKDAIEAFEKLDNSSDA